MKLHLCALRLYCFHVNRLDFCCWQWSLWQETEWCSQLCPMHVTTGKCERINAPPETWWRPQLPDLLCVKTLKQTCCPKTCHLHVLMILSWKHLRKRRCRKCYLTIPFHLKVGHTCPVRKVPSPCQEEENILLLLMGSWYQDEPIWINLLMED